MTQTNEQDHEQTDEQADGRTRIALVTGANKGIGYAIARGLAAEGFRVGVGARDDGRRDAAVAALRDSGARGDAVLTAPWWGCDPA